MRKNRRIKAGWNLENENEPDIFDHVCALIVSAAAVLFGMSAMWLITTILTEI